MGTWVWWLAAPLLATLLAAVGTWWRNRLRPPPTSEQTVIDHRQFLDHLTDAIDPPAARRS